MGLTHLDDEGRARMVDVGGKDVTDRRARVEGFVSMRAETMAALRAGDGPKGDVLGTARIAGIQAAKQTPSLIPLCHAIALTSVEVLFELEETRVRVVVETRCRDRTGVEMEAMVAASVAALTIYDMLKAVDREMVIGGVRLLEKSGGRSGHFVASE